MSIEKPDNELRRSLSVTKILAVCLLALLTTCMITPQDSNSPDNFPAKLTQLREFVHDLQQKGLFDGEVLIAQGKTILEHFCSPDVEAAAKNGGQPQFLIGSVSKQFTAVALLKALYDISPENDVEGKCAWIVKQLYKPLSKFLPADAPLWSGAMPAWAHTVTLHHLLTHTSGIAQPIGNLFRTKGFEGVWAFLSSPHSPHELIRMVIDAPVEFGPGKNYSYSNVGYTLLTEVVGALTNMPFAHYLQYAIFEPLEMTKTCHPQLCPPGVSQKVSCGNVYLISKILFCSLRSATRAVIRSIMMSFSQYPICWAMYLSDRKPSRSRLGPDL